MIRACVIGLGPIGNRHSGLLKADPLAELVGVCDLIHARADAAADKFGAPAFYDVEQMLRSLAPDMVIVATGGEEYGSDHYLPTMQALEAGCHVLGENPISNRIDQAEGMVAKAKEKGVCYGINLNHRFTPGCDRGGGDGDRAAISASERASGDKACAVRSARDAFPHSGAGRRRTRRAT